MYIDKNKSKSSSEKTLYLLAPTGVNNEIFKLIDSINEVSPTFNLQGFAFYNRNSINPSIYERNNDSKIYLANNLDRGIKYFENGVTTLLYNGAKFCNLIHPSVDLNRVNIGNGCIIQNGVFIGSNTTIGNYVTIRLDALINNNVFISDNVFIGPNASIGNNVRLHKNCFIGIASVISDGVTIGQNSTVGAGAVVVDNVPPNVTVIGVPAKPMRK